MNYVFADIYDGSDLRHLHNMTFCNWETLRDLSTAIVVASGHLKPGEKPEAEYQNGPRYLIRTKTAEFEFGPPDVAF